MSKGEKYCAGASAPAGSLLRLARRRPTPASLDEAEGVQRELYVLVASAVPGVKFTKNAFVNLTVALAAALATTTACHARPAIS